VPRPRLIAVLLSIYAVIWAALAIAPLHRDDWLLENALVVVGLAVLIATYRRFPLSRASYLCIFAFLVLHAIGAHYTYAEVPYEQWSRAAFGTSINEAFGWQRNHFDRLVHFSYGLLLAYPIREVFVRVANVYGFWGYFLPLDLTMSTSMLYELIEWGAAEVFGGDLGAAFLGSQGDVWDAHKDMALASIGALLTMALVAAINATYKRDFAREWVHSLRVKQQRPLGE
jgi:putative membrane protein